MPSAGMSMSWSPLENVTYEFALLSLVVPCMSSPLTWRVCVMEDKWSYSCWYEGCCFHDLFKNASRILKKSGGHIGRNVMEKNNKDEGISLKTLNDKNHQALSQKFRQLILA